MNIYEQIATEIVDENFDYMTGAEMSGQITSVSGWLSGHLGELNTNLYTAFSGDTPNLGIEESSIFKQMYMTYYYRKKANDSLRGIDDSVSWVTLKEGDSSITRTNKNEVAKNWRGLFNDSREELKELIAKYNIYNASPVQVWEYEL